jgi:hypothetical protein
MSTEALTGAARAILGSVADAVVRAARCPVLLLRREPPVPVEANEMADGDHTSPTWLPPAREGTAWTRTEVCQP